MIKYCRQLTVWQKAMDLMVESHRLAAKLPQVERFDLGSQIRRASVSVPANISEGNARSHRKEYLHFLSIARGSLSELDTLLEGARRVNYFTESDLLLSQELIDHVSRMLSKLIASLREKEPTSPYRLPRRVPSPAPRAL
jgi:four helix bundle protein